MTTADHATPVANASGGKRWYVMRSTFNRSLKAYDHLRQNGFEAYVPMTVVEKVVDRRLTQVTVPLIPNMVFVLADEPVLRTFIKEHKEKSFLTPYYDHFDHSAERSDHYLSVPTRQMDNFILATSVPNKHMMVVDGSKVRYKSGDLVRIVEGDFMGVVGKVARVNGQSRVVVTLDGICSVATAYIPSAFLEPYSDKGQSRP